MLLIISSFVSFAVFPTIFMLAIVILTVISQVWLCIDNMRAYTVQSMCNKSSHREIAFLLNELYFFNYFNLETILYILFWLCINFFINMLYILINKIVKIAYHAKPKWLRWKNPKYVHFILLWDVWVQNSHIMQPQEINLFQPWNAFSEETMLSYSILYVNAPTMLF